MQVEARSLKCHHSCMIDEETSKRITSLRFLLACFVVFIHNHPQEVNFADCEVQQINPDPNAIWQK